MFTLISIFDKKLGCFRTLVTVRLYFYIFYIIFLNICFLSVKQSVRFLPLLASRSPLDTLNVIKLSVQSGCQGPSSSSMILQLLPAPQSPCPPSGHLVNVSLTIVNRLKQRRATIMAAVRVPCSRCHPSIVTSRIRIPPKWTWLCLPALLACLGIC